MIQSMTESSHFLQKEKNSFTFLDHSTTAYKFKTKKPIPKGQYRIPFTMKLPQKLPGSFHYVNKQKKESTDPDPEDLKIAYYFDCFVDGFKYELYCEKEVVIRQFLFTEQEIHEDL